MEGNLTVTSPNGGPVKERHALAQRFAHCLSINPFLSRRIVSYQGNRNAPGFRWMKYKEGFSTDLVEYFIEKENPKSVLDPFAGICTTPLVASGLGCQATGIEIMPVGVLAGEAIANAANGLLPNEFNRMASALLKEVQTRKTASEYFFQHVAITKGAFPTETEKEIARARQFLSNLKKDGIHSLLQLACLSVLENASYTRKDGQYLRWDRRGKRGKSTFDLGPVPRFSTVLKKRLAEIAEDISILKEQFGGESSVLCTGSCFEMLPDIPAGVFDMVITSPPYANRYDYTRTYALELAWMGFDQNDFTVLRQKLLSATVENKTKRIELATQYGSNRNIFDIASQMFDSQGAVHEVLDILRTRQNELNNRGVLTLIQGYFFEMAIIIAELGRIVRPGGVVIMVNDNVQYHGEDLPVDFILADFAEAAGFHCDSIWVLPGGKGNSSQQMARFARTELRKCVYKWVKSND